MMQTIRYLFLLSIIIFIDQITKYWALQTCEPLAINKFVSCDVVINRGVSWSLFDSSSTSLFIILSMLIVLIVIFFAWYTYMRLQVGYAIAPHIMVLAGAISNLIDRVHYNGVVDFIALHAAGYHFPIFNCADISIVIGIGLLCLYEQ